VSLYEQMGEASAPEPVRPSASQFAFEHEFADFYEQHYRSMVRLAYVLTRDSSVAEETVQDAFAGLLIRWDRVNHPQAYVRAAVVNKARTHRRRRDLERDRRPVSSGAATDPRDVELEDALAALPYRQQAALVLHYYEDLSEAQIADALRCRPGTVKSLTSRALAALRAAIEP
jgi:RNA polymerase sigma-70 factor (sigma-E family)